jgi:hypothetical protein
MTSPKRVLTGLALAALLASAAVAALAQPAAAPGADGPDAGRRQAWAQQWQAHRQAHMEAEARRLHDVLNLKPDQDAALHTLLAALAPAHKDGEPGKGPDGGWKHDDGEQLTTPQRLDRMAARFSEHQAAFQQKAAAIKQFYAVLSPEQQRAFDALPGLMHPHMGHMHGMGPERMGMGPPMEPDLLAEGDAPPTVGEPE